MIFDSTGIPKCLFCPSNSHCEIRKVYGYKLLALCACDPGYTKFGRICKGNCSKIFVPSHNDNTIELFSNFDRNAELVDDQNRLIYRPTNPML